MGKGRHVKKGDEVVVVSGDHRLESGNVIEVIPQCERVLVEGLNMIKKHVRKSQDNPNGKIMEREGPIHWSNVMLRSRYEERKAKRVSQPVDVEENQAGSTPAAPAAASEE